MDSIKKLAKRIKKAKNIAIFTHISPDFDAFGSAFSLHNALCKLNKKVDIFSKENLSLRQKLLFEDIVHHNECKLEDYDLFICVDVSSLNRLGDYVNIFSNTNNETMILDHHLNGQMVSKYSYVNHNRSSCCEIIFELINALKVKIDSKMASYLYAGLSSDTSSFQNSSTKINCHIVASKLIELGADIHNVNKILYETQSLKEISFKKYLYNNYKVQKDCAYCLVDYNAITELKGKKSDCDTFSRSLVSIQGVNKSFSLIEEKQGVFNLSLRSKVGYDVRIIAEKLGGGGHVCAAGAKFEAKDMKTAKKMVLDAIKESENI